MDKRNEIRSRNAELEFAKEELQNNAENIVLVL